MKVMLSLPEESIHQLDELARRDGTSRSAVVRRLAEAAAVDQERRRKAELVRLYGSPVPRGGDAQEALKEHRRQH
jgi:metal-responsive CopG/Arc/MetJ family transcriptional regulator